MCWDVWLTLGNGERLPFLQSLLLIAMFGGRAFRSWAHVVAGACAISVLFLGVMVMAEEVIGDGARVTRAGLVMSAAAFLGYVGVAWLIRRDEASPR